MSSAVFFVEEQDDSSGTLNHHELGASEHESDEHIGKTPADSSEAQPYLSAGEKDEPPYPDTKPSPRPMSPMKVTQELSLCTDAEINNISEGHIKFENHTAHGGKEEVVNGEGAYESSINHCQESNQSGQLLGGCLLANTDNGNHVGNSYISENISTSPMLVEKDVENEDEERPSALFTSEQRVDDKIDSEDSNCHVPEEKDIALERAPASEGELGLDCHQDPMESIEANVINETTLSPERQSTVEKPPHVQEPEKEVTTTVNTDEKTSNSQSPTLRKHAASPERAAVGRKRAASRDLSPRARKKSTSTKESSRRSHHQDGSSHRRSASPGRKEPTRRDSPRKRDSPRRRSSPRRRDRSKSRSPSRRRERYGRSRSRSPYDRNRRRSPRRNHSPRRRSPSSYRSRGRSPRRAWTPPRNRDTGLGKPGRNLFIAGFSHSTTERDLEIKFLEYGLVRGVRVVRDRRSGDSRCYGFVSLEKDEEADAAIRAMDGAEWNGRIVMVEKSKSGQR